MIDTIHYIISALFGVSTIIMVVSWFFIGNYTKKTESALSSSMRDIETIQNSIVINDKLINSMLNNVHELSNKLRNTSPSA